MSINRRSFKLVLLALILAAVVLVGSRQSSTMAASSTSGGGATANSKVVKSYDSATIKAKQAKRVTNTQREAAAKRAATTTKSNRISATPAQGGTPNYFGPEPNWAYSPQPTVGTGGTLSGGIRKFVDTLPNLVGATPDTTTYPNADYYEIAVVQYTAQLHTDLKPTTLRGYVQISTTTVPGAHIPLNYPNGSPILDTQGNQVYAVAAPSYLGPTIVATKDKPVRVKFTNYLPTGTGGNLFLPVDTTEMGAGMGPLGMNTTPGKPMNYTQNRATMHLHGGDTVWISDGTPHQWITPAGENTDYPKGVSVQNVPDMPDPGPGSMTFYYSNQQSARLMFYHDHSYGITRLNVYAGEAAGYVITDATEQDLINRSIIPAAADTKVLVIQDKTFVDTSTVLTTDPTWPIALNSAHNDLWTPHVYMTNQNPNDAAGVNALGRWDYGPWFWPPWTTTKQPITNSNGTVSPNLPDNSMTMESFQDTPIVNGKAYPTVTVDPKTYRFRILNASDDRMWNLQLYQASNVISDIKVTGGGSGYTTTPLVTITNASGDTTGHGATAVATIDTTTGSPTFGQVTAIDLVTVGSGYTAAPTVTMAAPSGGTAATATTTLYTGGTEVGMVPASPGAANFPASWTAQTTNQPGDILDNRTGGVPDPANIGPSMIQIGNEGGFLPSPTTIENRPIGYDRDPKSITIGNVKEHALLLGPAERADVVIDFSQYAGKTIILYNDSPAPVPATDSRYDYYTADTNQTDIGGSNKTHAGYGPNTRTIMQIKVSATTPAAAYNTAALQAEFTSTATTQGVFARSQDKVIVPQNTYNSAYNASFPSGTTAYSRISNNSLTFTPIGSSTPVTINFKPKAIQELFEDTYGRMSGFLGVEIPNTNGTNQTTIPYGYIDPATEIVDDSTSATQIGATGDGTQIWKITHNGVDTHPIHFHLFDVQVINRVDWAGVIKPPDANELGWKETVRMNPLEDCIVALRPKASQNPFGAPDSVRPLDPTMPIGSTLGFKNINPDGTPTTPAVTNQLTNFGWEYVWHCHILSHEEMDMMRPIKFNVARSLPQAPVLTGSSGTGGNTLNWTDGTPYNYTTKLPATTLGNPANEIGFKIERAPGTSPTYTQVGTALANKTTYIDTTAASGQTYKYRVTAYNAAGNSVSNVLNITTGGTALTRVEQNSSLLRYSGTWSTQWSSGSSGGNFYYATGAGNSVTIAFNGTRLDLIGVKASAYGKADISVDGGAATVVDLYSATALYQQTLFTTGTLTAGLHTVTVSWDPTNAAGKLIDIDAVDVAGSVVQLTRAENNSTSLIYNGTWSTQFSSGSSGGNFYYATGAGNSVTIPFNGTRLDLIGVKASGYGKADISVDGGAATVVDLYSATALYQQTLFTTGTLAAGLHTVTVSWDPTNAAGKLIDIDAVDVFGGSVVAKTRIQQNDSLIHYVPNPWTTVSTTAASGGSYVRASATTSSVTINFSGARLDWIAGKATIFGKAKVSLDGKAAVSVSLYSTTALYQQTVWSSGFVTPGNHTVVITYDTTNAAGLFIDLDAVDVVGSLR